MLKTLVTYDSRTGNTKHIAEAIYEVIVEEGYYGTGTRPDGHERPR